jgi:predicted transposase YdaD
MAQPYDAATKYLVEHFPSDWLRWSGGPPGPVEVIDSDLASITAAADKVIRVAGNPPWLYHLELQADHDTDLPERLHLYNTLLGYRLGLLVRTTVLLLRPAANSPRLTGLLQQGFPSEGPYLEFRYRVVRLWEQPLTSLLSGGLGLLPLAPVCDEASADVPAVVRRLTERFESEASLPQREELWTATNLLMGLRFERAEVAIFLRGVRDMRSSTTYQAILEEGRTEGALREARETLIRLGTLRFGPPDVNAQGVITGISSLDRLRDLQARLLQVANWSELLASP